MMHKYFISADGGRTWTAQWLTEEEVARERDCGFICIKSY